MKYSVLVLFCGLLSFGILAVSCSSAPEKVDDSEGPVRAGEEPDLSDGWSDARRELEDQWVSSMEILPMSQRSGDMYDFQEDFKEKQIAAVTSAGGMEKYFEESDGDREIFGWFNFRRWQMMLSFSCDMIFAMPPDELPEDQIPQFKEQMIPAAADRLDQGRLGLELVVRESVAPWRGLAQHALEEIEDFRESPEETCEDLAEYWHPDAVAGELR